MSSIVETLRSYASQSDISPMLKCVLAEAAATIESLEREIDALRNKKMRKQYSRGRDEVDSGCKYADDCFECPFPDCVLTTSELDDTEEEALAKRKIVVETAMIVKRLYDSGMNVEKISFILNRDLPLVQRDLIIAREELKRNAEQTGHQAD